MASRNASRSWRESWRYCRAQPVSLSDKKGNNGIRKSGRRGLLTQVRHNDAVRNGDPVSGDWRYRLSAQRSSAQPYRTGQYPQRPVGGKECPLWQYRPWFPITLTAATVAKLQGCDTGAGDASWPAPRAGISWGVGADRFSFSPSQNGPALPRHLRETFSSTFISSSVPVVSTPGRFCCSSIFSLSQTSCRDFHGRARPCWVTQQRDQTVGPGRPAVPVQMAGQHF